MITVISSSGFFIHDCTEDQFDQAIIENNRNQMPNKYLTGWLFMSSSSINIIKKLDINTGYVDVDGKSKNYIKRDIEVCLKTLTDNISVSQVENKK
jgi:hypothetical protein